MNEDLLQLTAEIVTAHLSHNKVGAADLPTLIQATHAALEKANAPAEQEAAAPVPAVSIRTSVKPDYIVCLEDGKKLTMLKRYLRTNFGMSPEAYRAKWNLPRDYPMVAPNYADKRRVIAQAIGLGRTAKDSVTTAAASARNDVEPGVASLTDAASSAIDSGVQPIAAAVKSGRKKLGIAAKAASKPRQPRAPKAEAATPASDTEAAKPE